jgi:hypothetical protein
MSSKLTVCTPVGDLNPKSEINQCDGCARGLPVDTYGRHTEDVPNGYSPDGFVTKVVMGCTKRMYD